MTASASGSSRAGSGAACLRSHTTAPTAVRNNTTQSETMNSRRRALMAWVLPPQQAKIGPDGDSIPPHPPKIGPDGDPIGRTKPFQVISCWCRMIAELCVLPCGHLGKSGVDLLGRDARCPIRVLRLWRGVPCKPRFWLAGVIGLA